VRRVLLVAAAVALLWVPAAAGAAPLRLHWLRGVSAPGTPSRLDRVGVLQIGSARARNVLVLMPGTSAGSAYFVPLARWLVATLPGWQVWSVERRENQLEDQSVVDRTKLGRTNSTGAFNYYLGWLGGAKVSSHVHLLGTGEDPFAKRWGMAVTVGDLQRVITAAKARGGKVVLGGHSLGGSVVTAYATWDFGHGRSGAADLAGLVYIDGSSFTAPESAAAARSALAALDASSQSPWLTFGGIAAPFAGLFEVTGGLGALLDPNSPSLGQEFGPLPAALKPSVRVTNLAQYGFAQNVGTSPASLIAAQAHLGKGVATSSVNGVHGWDSTGALTPILRFAQMFAGANVLGADGVEWYFPQRLTDDTAAVGNGLANPAQSVLDVHSTLGRKLPHSLLMYAFGARLGGAAVLQATQALAKQSGIPASHLTLINRQSTYAHNDPAGAYPHNAFFSGLIPFLKRAAAAG
jgi:hypothetical protein